MTKTQLQTLSDLVSIAHDEYDGCPSYRDDLERYDKLLADIKAEQSHRPSRNVDLPECRTLAEAWKVFERGCIGMWSADWDAAFVRWLFEPVEAEGGKK